MKFYRPITESQIQESLQNEKDNEYKAEVNAALTAETNSRIATDTALQNALTSEINSRIATDTALQNALTAETNSRIATDTALQNALTAETNSRIAADTALQNALTAETNSRIATDTALQNALTAETNSRIATDTALQNALTAEINARIATDTALQAALTNEESNRAEQFQTVGNAINAEVNARTNAINALTSAVNQIQTQLTTDATIKSALENEIAARTGESTNINSAIDGLRSLHILDKADLQSSISAEQSARISSDTAIINSLTAETNARIASDTAIISSLAGETSARIASDTAINTALHDEVTLRANQTASLSSALSSEVLTRAGNFTSASNSISAVNNALNAEITNRTNKDSQLQSSLESAVTNFNNAYRVFTSSTTSAPGQAGIVPAPPQLADSDTVYYLTNRGWGEPIEIDIKIGTIPSQTGSLTFNGQTQSPQWNDYDPLALEITGTTSASDAGTYTAYFQPRDGYKWTNGTKDRMSATWTIGAYIVTVPTAATTSFEYTGNSITLNVTNFDSTGSSQTGTTSATNKGDYVAKYELKNTNNYKWSDNTTAAKTISWHITVKSIDKPTISNTSFDYDGNSHSPTVSGFNASWMSKSGTESSTDAGNFTITVSLTDKTNTKWSDNTTADVALNWVINRKKLTAAQSTGFEQNGTITYGGLSDEWTVSIKNYDSTIHKLSGDVKKTYAGTYTAYVSPTDNLCWSDGTFDAKPVTWEIQKHVVTKPTSKGTLTYNGSTQTGVNVPDGYANFYCNVTGKTAKDVGNYTCTYSITNLNKSSVVWEDGTTADVVLSWSIVQGEGIVKPTLAANSFEWTGSNISPTINNYNSSVMTKTGTDTAVARGVYDLTFALKDKINTSWADGSTDDVHKSWAITTRNIAQPSLATSSYTYDGNSKTPTVNNFDSTYTQKAASSTNSATNAGSYSIVISLKDKDNCQWAGAATADITLNWVINRKLLSAVTFSQSGSLTYNGSTQNVTITNYDSTTMTMSSTTSAVNASTYTAKVAPKDNYAWSDGSYAAKSVSWTIAKLTLTKPTLSNATYTYDGNNHSPTINNYDSTRENMTGTTDTATAGTYTVTFSLKDTTNTQWSGNTTANVECSWTINKADNVLTSSTYEIIFNSTNYQRFVSSNLCSWSGDGELTISITSEDNLITYTEHTRNSFLITGHGYSSGIITVKVNEGTNYKESNSIQINVRSEIVRTFDFCTLNEIIRVLKAGKAQGNWNIGDQHIFNFKPGNSFRSGSFRARIADFWDATNSPYMASWGRRGIRLFITQSFNTPFKPASYDSLIESNPTANDYCLRSPGSKKAVDHWEDVLSPAIQSAIPDDLKEYLFNFGSTNNPEFFCLISKSCVTGDNPSAFYSNGNAYEDGIKYWTNSYSHDGDYYSYYVVAENGENVIRTAHGAYSLGLVLWCDIFVDDD